MPFLANWSIVPSDNHLVNIALSEQTLPCPDLTLRHCTRLTLFASHPDKPSLWVVQVVLPMPVQSPGK